MTSENEKLITDLPPEENGEPSFKDSEVSEEPLSLPATDETDNEDPTDYGELLKSDMQELSEEFSKKEALRITDLKDPLRYGALRDLGLTPREAYLASGGKKEKLDNRAHLSSSVPRKMSVPFSEIPRSELDTARELFDGMSDSEIRNLYRKVTQ